eukprot:396442-Prymnesium_polylepis.1
MYGGGRRDRRCAAHSRQTASRHRVLDASRDSRLVTASCAAPRPLPRTDWPSVRLPRRCSETV